MKAVAPGTFKQWIVEAGRRPEVKLLFGMIGVTYVLGVVQSGFVFWQTREERNSSGEPVPMFSGDPARMKYLKSEEQKFKTMKLPSLDELIQAAEGKRTL